MARASKVGPVRPLGKTDFLVIHFGDGPPATKASRRFVVPCCRAATVISGPACYHCVRRLGFSFLDFAMKSRLLRGVALPVLLASPAMAADLPVKAPPAPAPLPVVAPNWTGFYVGLNAGGAWATADPNTSASCVPALGFPNAYLRCIDVPLVNAAGTGSMSGSTFIGGGQVGYNWQSNNTVLGVEADFNSFHLRASRQATTFYTGLGSTFTVSNSVSTDWLFTARGRLGWAFDYLLAYVTGGLALTNLGTSNTFADASINQSWTGSTTKAGWTVGGGLEWALNRNWSVKAEYLYVKFASVNASGFLVSPTPPPGYANAISTSTDLTAHIARGGVNYKF
jgi:outer membrane immunogenic protein